VVLIVQLNLTYLLTYISDLRCTQSNQTIITLGLHAYQHGLPLDMVTALKLNSLKTDLTGNGCNRILNIIGNLNYQELGFEFIYIFVS